MKKILIAGTGNVFGGDNAFGCEVLRQLEKCALPENVELMDFGIRMYDLAYALRQNYQAIILVDALPGGRSPGTVSLAEPDLDRNDFDVDEDTYAAHPIAAIRMAQTLGGIQAKLYLVTCEPVLLDNEIGELGLSLRVQEAIPQALAMIESLIANLAPPDAFVAHITGVLRNKFLGLPFYKNIGRGLRRVRKLGIV